MKKRVLKFSAVMLAVAFITTGLSCNETDNDAPVVEDPVLSIDPSVTSIEFSVDGLSATSEGLSVFRTFEVITNQKDWDVEVENGYTWLHADRANTGDTFNLRADENTNAEPREEGKVTVSAGDAASIIITVTQKGTGLKTPTLEISSKEAVVINAAGTAAITGALNYTVTITNVADWDAVSDRSWLSINKTASTFTLSAVANDFTVSPEPAMVTITAGSAAPIILDVSQNGNPDGMVAASAQTWTIAHLMLSDYIEYDGNGKLSAGTIEQYATPYDYRNNPNYGG